MSIKIGILDLQGDIGEHEKAFTLTCEKIDAEFEIKRVKDSASLSDVDCIVIPGGESTSISRLAFRSSILAELRRRIVDGLPTLGTCAGLVMLAKRVKDRVIGETGQETLGVLNVEVERNFFRRQRESFETLIDIPCIEGGPFRAVFIRAPVVTSMWSGDALAFLQGKIVMVREGRILAVSFHPELTQDTRIHEFFLRDVADLLD
ncbi:MAG: pyridoxal 5'-phosphate synthase glutaminase subunit PdxT [Thermoproteota archaeon]